MNSVQLIIQGALQAHRSGNLSAAIQGYRMALAAMPHDIGLINQYAVAELQSQRLDEALRLFERSIQLQPRQPDVLSNMAYVLNIQGEHARAVECCDRSLALVRSNPEAQTNKGNALRALGRFSQALTCFDAALSVHPDRPEYLYNRANVLLDLGQLEPAIADYSRALALAPGVRQIRMNLAAAMIRTRRVGEAITHLEEALRMDAADPLAWMNLGAAYDTARMSVRAVECFRKAIELQPENAAAHANLAQVLDGTGQHAQAISHYGEALQIDPGLHECIGGRLMARRHINDLSHLEEETALLNNALSQGLPALTPFNAIVLLDDPKAVAEAITSHVEHRIITTAPVGQISRAEARDGKIRIGYFSADFGEHPVTYLLSPVLQAHDRQIVEVHAFLTQQQPPSAALHEVQARVDHFHDITGRSVEHIQQLTSSIRIDIAVDLGGHTLNSRPELFAARVAPVQVGYLGFPGPSGIGEMDYLLADDALIPNDLRPYYPEHVAYLDAYQANDFVSAVPSGAGAPRRADHGLPETAFVFCCFSNSYKFSPATLEMWIAILQATPASVLWLYADNPDSRANLAHHFDAQGIEPSRLHFADRVKRDDYLRRMQLADLYLDTTPYSAGTTASDALRVGLPILTLSGRTFSARMCTSVLRSAGLDELAVSTPQAYVDRAVQLCSDPGVLAVLRNKLIQGLSGSQLFNPAGTARQLESLYCQMHQLRRSGSPLTDLRVTGSRPSLDRQ